MLMRFKRRKPEARKVCRSDGDGAALDGDAVLMVVVLMVITVRVLELHCSNGLGRGGGLVRQ